MGRSFVFIVVGLFFFLIAFYIFRSFSPFDSSKLEEIVNVEQIEKDDWESLNKAIEKKIDEGFVFEILSPNAYLFTGVVLAGILMIFAAVHILIDFLFFKNYYEKPSYFNAFRRGFVFVGIILSLIVFRFYKTETYIVIGLPVFIFLFEVLFGKSLLKLFLKIFGNPNMSKKEEFFMPRAENIEIEKSEPRNIDYREMGLIEADNSTSKNN